MKLFNSIFTLIAVAALLSCGNGQAEYTVSATGAEEGTVVTLTDMLTGETIASQEITDGVAVFQGKADKNALLSIGTEGSDWQTPFFADGQPVEIDLEENSLLGSELNEKLCACDKEASDIYNDVLHSIAEFSELDEAEQAARVDEINAKIEGVGDCYKRILDENRDNLVPVAFISELAQMAEEDELEDLFNPKYAYAKHPYVLSVKEKIEKRNAMMKELDEAKAKLIGSKFIDLEEPDTEGNMHKLSEYVGQGKWVFIDFWASWCGPCCREMPNVVEAYKKYHPKGLEIVGLSFDNDKDAWVKAIKDLEMPWIHLSDLKGWQTVASDTYGVKSIPASLLVNPEGIVVARDLRGNALGDKLAEIFGE